MATLTVRTALMKSPVKLPSASRPSTLVPTTLLCASPPTRSAMAKWTAQTARMRDPSAVTLATSHLPIHRFASDPLRNAACLHVRSRQWCRRTIFLFHFFPLKHQCSAVASTLAPLMWLFPCLKVLSEFLYPTFSFLCKTSDLSRQMSVGRLSVSFSLELWMSTICSIFIFDFP